MAKRSVFALVCALVSFHAAAWGQAPGMGPAGPGGPAPGPYAYGPAPGPMGPFAGGPMMGSSETCCPMVQSIPDWEFFGDFLYLRPRNATLPYAVIFNGPADTPPTAATPVQVAPVGTLSFDYHAAFRVGAARALDECNAVVGTYTHFDTLDEETQGTDTFLIRSMVSHPSTWVSNATTDWLQAAASYQMKYDLANVDFRWTFQNDGETRLSLLGGLGYASLGQKVNVDFVSLGIENVHSQVNFEGGGIRCGIEGERKSSLGLVVYGKATASFIAGTARAAYGQSTVFDDGLVNTAYRSDRIVPILDGELGFGWAGPQDRLRITAGYTIAGWFNMIRAGDYIRAVQNNDYSGMNEVVTFDGFVSRIELRF